VADSSELTVKIEPKPSTAKALILFLSENKNYQQCESASSIAELENNNWQMPLIAIDYHEKSLESVYFITSAESGRQEELFKKAVKKFIPQIDSLIIKKHSDDINFEDGKEIFESLDFAYKQLIAQGLKKELIYIDLTGGTKVVALVGSIFALPEDRVVQYVSTKDKEVRLYDLQYHPKN
jgi:CRISPR-associated protein (Cas_Cas02710)